MPAAPPRLTGPGTGRPAVSSPMGCPGNDGLLGSAGTGRDDRSGRHHRGRVLWHRLGLDRSHCRKGEGTQSRGEQMPESCTSHLFNSLSFMGALSFNAGYPSVNLMPWYFTEPISGHDTVHKDRPQPAGLLGETDGP